MKLITLVLALGLSSSAFALTSVYHDYSGALRGIALDNACVTANAVQTITATRNCTELVPVVRRDADNTYTDWVCKTWQVSKLSYPRSFSRTVCADYAYEGDGNLVCKATAQKEDVLPDTIKIRVVTSNGEADNYPGVAQEFTFPKCK